MFIWKPVNGRCFIKKYPNCIVCKSFFSFLSKVIFCGWTGKKLIDIMFDCGKTKCGILYFCEVPQIFLSADLQLSEDKRISTHLLWRCPSLWRLGPQQMWWLPWYSLLPKQKASDIDPVSGKKLPPGFVVSRFCLCSKKHKFRSWLAKTLWKKII